MRSLVLQYLQAAVVALLGRTAGHVRIAEADSMQEAAELNVGGAMTA